MNEIDCASEDEDDVTEWKRLCNIFFLYCTVNCNDGEMFIIFMTFISIKCYRSIFEA